MAAKCETTLKLFNVTKCLKCQGDTKCFHLMRMDAYDYGVVDKKMFPTIDDLRKAITAFQVDGECVSIQKDEINYPISPSVLQEINAEYNGRNLLDVVGNMIHQYPEQRRYREQRCIDIYGKLI